MSAGHRPATRAVGFVTPPRWVSPSPVEFASSVVEPVVAQQCFPDLPDFGYTLAEVAAARTACERAAAMLGEAGCAAVAMEGTPFAWAGGSGEAGARGRVASMADAAGVRAVMAATAIVDGLRALGVERVALCPTYYPPDWRDAWSGFVASCGFDVVYCRTMADQGITSAIDDLDQFGWATGPDRIVAAIERCAEVDDTAEAVVVTGAGCRTTPIIDDLERRAGRPVLGADGALFWALAQAAGLTLRAGAVGELTRAAA
ncbi:MAG: hypothetical protein QNJ12_16685 [Ilumatobacter sp.]|uniref:aspartate racemase/maleate isomerase family protein n=1 Tax=Ilumatobacter sp. TaxID=1967498 RepID=UPI0026057AFC|nr:hypothetical protein [Ilumatobacter sp.]MDJ0770434.1 hypothetical protein [Ilumatobacter sp.]